MEGRTRGFFRQEALALSYGCSEGQVRLLSSVSDSPSLLLRTYLFFFKGFNYFEDSAFSCGLCRVELLVGISW